MNFELQPLTRQFIVAAVAGLGFAGLLLGEPKLAEYALVGLLALIKSDS